MAAMAGGIWIDVNRLVMRLWIIVCE